MYLCVMGVNIAYFYDLSNGILELSRMCGIFCSLGETIKNIEIFVS